MDNKPGHRIRKKSLSNKGREDNDNSKMPVMIIGGALIGNLIAPGVGGAICGGIIGGIVSNQRPSKTQEKKKKDHTNG
jgi:hypothetical protein